MKILKLPSLICDVLLIADGMDSKCTTASFELEYPTYNRLYILDYIYYSDKYNSWTVLQPNGAN